MERSKLESVVKEAQERLRQDPFDEGHDYDHHLAVVTNCLAIVEGEGLEVDIDALLIAAWWHDYKRNNTEENDRILTQAMEKAGYLDVFIVKVKNIKNSHSFGNGQESLEQKVLFDADKLEYASKERIAKVSKAVKEGRMKPEVQEKYKRAFIERIPVVLQSLHFESSKVKMKSNLKEFLEYASSDPLWTQVAEACVRML